MRRAVAQQLGAGGPQWRLAVSDPDPDSAGALLALVERKGPERLVVGARRRSPVGKLLLSVEVPVVLVEPPAR